MRGGFDTSIGRGGDIGGRGREGGGGFDHSHRGGGGDAYVRGGKTPSYSGEPGSSRHRMKQREAAVLTEEDYPARRRSFDGEKPQRGYDSKHWKHKHHGHHHHRHLKRHKNFIYFYDDWWYTEPWWTYDPYTTAEDEHVRWCRARYRSYVVRNNTYVTFSGKRRQCISPYWKYSVVGVD
jgi:hypothetical protein